MSLSLSLSLADPYMLGTCQALQPTNLLTLGLLAASTCVEFPGGCVMKVIVWANKSCDNGYPDVCLHWAGFLAKLAIHYDRVSDGSADVGMMNRVCLAHDLQRCAVLRKIQS